MRRGKQLSASLLQLGLASAQSIVENLSFGHILPLSQGGGISGWQLSSVNHEAQLLSDRVILTPPVPGNAKGALWSENTVPSETWTAELEFRASGQDSGSGNLQLWYTRDRQAIGVNSVYNVDNFDGMALVIDQYGGRGGAVRGFLNDGTQNYRTHTSLESVAFGHCDYAYRNLGRPSKVRINNNNGLTVTIDDRVCFSSDKITLPAGYHFGLTASTADNPDSFEINRLTVWSGEGQPAAQQPDANAGRPSSPLQRLDKFPGAPESVPDSSADDIKSQSEQFADLHNRLQGLTHQMANMLAEFAALSDKIDQKSGELASSMQNMRGSSDTGLPPETIGTINRLSAKVDGVEVILNQVRREVEGKDYREHLERLNAAIERVHGGLSEHLPDRIGHRKLLNTTTTHDKCCGELHWASC